MTTNEPPPTAELTPTPTAVVEELWRYPVKSMQGEPLATAVVGIDGIEGDRAWGVVSADGRHVLSAKTVPELLFASASLLDDGEVAVTLPSGAVVLAGTPEADDALTTWLGRPVRLLSAADAHAASDDALDYEMTFEPPNDDAEVVGIPAPPGALVDLAPLHVLTGASLAAVRGARPELDWEPRRYRANVLLAVADGSDGFVEDTWVGRDGTLGTAGVHVQQSAVRCALPLRAQPGGIERDPELYRALDDLHANHLGAYVTVTGPGRCAVGDHLVL